MRIIIPMAGLGMRYKEQGYDAPKPFINVGKHPMLWWAMKSIEGAIDIDLEIIALKEHERLYHLRDLLQSVLNRDFNLHLLDSPTEGQLSTILSIQNKIQSQEDVLIFNIDTIVVSNIFADILAYKNSCSGIISVAKMLGDRWSFARADNEGNVVEVAEKNRISDLTSTGLYYFKNWGQVVREGNKMVHSKEKTKGEFYIMPLYQKLINAGDTIKLSHAEYMYDLGTPDSMIAFLSSDYFKHNN